MKFTLLIGIILLGIGCTDMSKNSQNSNELVQGFSEEVFVVSFKVIDKKELILNQLEGTWYFNGRPYNGYSLKSYPYGQTEERLGYYKGKREGVARRWSENGVLRVESHYHQNKLVGEYKTWWENGALAEESYYVNGLQQGEEKQWYPNGIPSKLRQLRDGKEVGLQKGWLQNGTLYVNYEVKNGRIFGMKRANLCYQLENEIVVRNEKS